MITYLDSAIVIYIVEQVPAFLPIVYQRISSATQIVVSDLSRLECRVHPIMCADQKRLSDFDHFFSQQVIRPITSLIFDEATLICARYRFDTPDALHLAFAKEAGCRRFLTNDHRLQAYSDLTVDVL